MTTSATGYEVTWGPKSGKKVRDIETAIQLAKEKVVSMEGAASALVWEDSLVVIALVTDDANGLTIHRLGTWPEDLECTRSGQMPAQ